MESTLSRTAVIVTGVVGGVLLVAGSVALAAFLAYDVMNLDGLLGFAAVALSSGAVCIGGSLALRRHFARG